MKAVIFLLMIVLVVISYLWYQDSRKLRRRAELAEAKVEATRESLDEWYNRSHLDKLVKEFDKELLNQDITGVRIVTPDENAE